MLRDNLNLYGVRLLVKSLQRPHSPLAQATWIVNLANVLFWFIIRPTGPADPIRTMLTSITAVLTTTMALRIILGVRGPLTGGGTFSGSWTSQTATSTSAHARAGAAGASRRSAGAAHTFAVDVPVVGAPVRKDSGRWPPAGLGDEQSGAGKEGVYRITPESDPALGSVKVTVDSHTEAAYGDGR
jgi:hypothetical protein